MCAAVTSLENNPVFNAGFGSCLTEEGTVEMDAFIMDGETLRIGNKMSHPCINVIYFGFIPYMISSTKFSSV